MGRLSWLSDSVREFFRKGDILLLTLCLAASGYGLILIYSATRWSDDNRSVIVQTLAIAMGVMVYAENEGEVFLGRSVTRTTHVSEATMQKIDAEVRRILEEQYARACDILKANRERVELMVQCLMKWETLDEEQIADIMEGREVRPPKPGASAKADDERREEQMKPVENPTASESQAKESEDKPDQK